MNIQLIEKSYLAEIAVPQSSTAQQFFFPVLNNLDGKFTQGISSYGVAAMPKAPSSTPIVNAALFASSFLNLFVGDVNQYWNLPLIDVVTVNSQLATGTVQSNKFAIEFNNVAIIWAKSFIFVADTSTISGAQNEVYAINIKYTDGIPSK